MAAYCNLSLGDSFVVREKTIETQNAKIVRAAKWDSSMRLFLSAHRDIERIQHDKEIEQTRHGQKCVAVLERLARGLPAPYPQLSAIK